MLEIKETDDKVGSSTVDGCGRVSEFKNDLELGKRDESINGELCHKNSVDHVDVAGSIKSAAEVDANIAGLWSDFPYVSVFERE